MSYLSDNLGTVKSFSEDGLIATSYADDYTTRGLHFLINKRETLGSEVTLTFLWDLSSVTGTFLLEPFALKSEDTKVTIKVYEGTDYTGGVAETSFNINRASSNTANATLNRGATGSDKGTLIREHVAFASGQGVNSNPAAINAININIFDTSKNYLVEIINEENSATDIEWSNSWFEF